MTGDDKVEIEETSNPEVNGDEAKEQSSEAAVVKPEEPASGREDNSSLTTDDGDPPNSNQLNKTTPDQNDGGSLKESAKTPDWYEAEIERLKRRQGGAESAYERASRLAQEREQENQRLQQQLEQLQQTQQAASLPVWHRDSPGYEGFQEKQKLYNVMEKQSRSVVDDESKTVFQQIWADAFTNEELDAIQANRTRGQELAARIASGDLSALDEHIEQRATLVTQQHTLQGQMRAELGQLLDDNKDLWEGDPTEMHAALQRGVPLDSFIAEKRRAQSMSTRDAELEDLKKQVSDMKAKQQLNREEEVEPQRDSKKAAGFCKSVEDIQAEVTALIAERNISRSNWEAQKKVLREVEAKYKT